MYSLAAAVAALAESCEPDAPGVPVGEGQPVHMEAVEAGQQQHQGDQGVHGGDEGVEHCAGQQGGKGQAQEGGGHHQVQAGVEEEAGDAGENQEGQEATEEGGRGAGDHGGEVAEAGTNGLGKLGDVGGATGVAADMGTTRRGLSLGVGGRPCWGVGERALASSPGLLRGRGSEGAGSVLGDGLEAKESEEGDPGGGRGGCRGGCRGGGGRRWEHGSQVGVEALPGLAGCRGLLLLLLLLLGGRGLVLLAHC